MDCSDRNPGFISEKDVEFLTVTVWFREARGPWRADVDVGRIASTAILELFEKEGTYLAFEDLMFLRLRTYRCFHL